MTERAPNFSAPGNMTDFIYIVIFGALTNVSMIPPMVRAWNYGMIVEAVIGAFCLLTSFLYHILQPLNQKRFLGGDSIKWHQADNIFAVSMFCFLVLNMAQIENILVVDAIKVLILCINICLQCLQPWDIRYSVLPVVVAAVLSLTHICWSGRTPNWDRRALVISLGCIFVGIACFILGLNEEFDRVRLVHGIWHILASLGFYHILPILHPAHMVEYRHSVYKHAVSLGSKRKQGDELEKDEITEKSFVVNVAHPMPPKPALHELSEIKSKQSP